MLFSYWLFLNGWSGLLLNVLGPSFRQNLPLAIVSLTRMDAGFFPRESNNQSLWRTTKQLELLTLKGTPTSEHILTYIIVFEFYIKKIATKVLCRISSWQTNALKFLIFRHFGMGLRHLGFLTRHVTDDVDSWSVAVFMCCGGTDQRRKRSKQR